jgi:predicted ATPase
MSRFSVEGSTKSAMIVSFSVSNFRSFSSEETFSLVASNRVAGKHANHAAPIPDSNESVLRMAVLYGANGAGKSNLFKALQFVKSVVAPARNQNRLRTPFRFGGGDPEPSCFDLQFVAGGKLYRYAFKVDDRRILEEWLVQVIGSREQTLYERTTDEGGKVAVELDGLNAVGPKMRALAQVGGHGNQSFLATVLATLEFHDLGEELKAIVDWFRNGLILIEPDQPFGGLGNRLATDPDFAEFFNSYLHSSSTGVTSIEPVRREIKEWEARQLLPDYAIDPILDGLPENGQTSFTFGKNNEFVIERNGSPRFFRVTLDAAHAAGTGDLARLPIDEESDGTRRLLNLIPVLYRLRSGGVCFIDEIDRSLHPMLVWKFLEFFLGQRNYPGGQIIVTTHESNLLDLDLLRRDEIWFAEKDPVGATHLHSLADFKVRNDLEIRKHYLQGRFGAVPFLGSLDRLLEEKREAQ